MRRLQLLTLFCLLVPAQVLGVSRFNERNHTGLLLLYGFDDGQLSSTSHPPQARDFSGRYLMGNLTTSATAVSWNATRQGMQVPQAGGGDRAFSPLTSANITPLLQNEFTLEFFISSGPLPTLPAQNLLIAGFGDWPSGSAFPTCDVSNTVSEGGWRLYSVYGDGTRVSIRFTAVVLRFGVPTCALLLFQILPNNLVHIVVRAKNGEMDMTSYAVLGGQNSYSFLDETTFDPSLWARHHAPLYVATPHSSGAWTGTVYMIAMFDRYISDVEITNNDVFGPPNSHAYGTVSALATPESEPITLYPAAS